VSLTIRQIEPDDKMCHQFALKALQSGLPQEMIEDTLTRLCAWEKRERKLNMPTVLLLSIALGLYPRQSIQSVLTQVSSPLRLMQGEQESLCTPGALCKRRKQLPVKVFQNLFQQVAHPLATADTPSAFWKGYRLMAIDSTLEDVPDTKANATFFGRVTKGSSQSPFPQVRCTVLQECGTHAIVDACLTPCRIGEATLARRLLRSVEKGMLVLMDKGFRGLSLFQGIKRRGGEILALAPSNILPVYEEALPDGTFRAILGKGRNCQDDPLEVRVLPYQVVLPDEQGTPTEYRLMTTLLDAQQYPASEVIAWYRQRWSVETTFAEIDGHQQIERMPLRSQSPLMILQELYAILIGHFLVRDLMHQAATLGEQELIAPTCLSFTQAVIEVCTSCNEQMLLEDEEAPRLQEQLLHRVRKARLPASHTRMLRVFPRVVKHAPSKFRRKKATDVSICRKDLTWESLFSLSQ
jgi:hypothetical protein